MPRVAWHWWLRWLRINQEEREALCLLKDGSCKGSFINILILWNRTKYLLLRRKKLNLVIGEDAKSNRLISGMGGDMD